MLFWIVFIVPCTCGTPKPYQVFKFLSINAKSKIS